MNIPLQVAASSSGNFSFIILIVLLVVLPCIVSYKQSKKRKIDALPAILIALLLSWIGVIIVMCFPRKEW